MRGYSYKNKWQQLLTPEIVSLLTRIHEFKGEQLLFIEAHEDQLYELMEIAKIQSTEASNKIEGIYTSDERLKKIVLDKTTPKTRNEFEIAGYRDVLNTIHSNYEHIPVKPSVILQLHRDLYRFCGQEPGGHYKMADNVITETDGYGNERVRFTPVPAWETPEAMEVLCQAYEEAVTKDMADPLLIIPMFILDFLCIHPFHDGNGRMSRLMTLLLLYRTDYIVGKYISIEKLIELSKDTYYEALQKSSQNWHQEENEYAPFVEYLLGVIVNAYREFSTRVKLLTNRERSKPERIQIMIQETLGTVTKTDIMKRNPDISQVTVQRTLTELVKTGKVIKIGAGRYTKYTWNREEEKI